MKRGERRLLTLAALATPLAQAVEPLRVEAVARVEKYTREHIARMVVELTAAGMDLNVVAPRPKASGGHNEYHLRVAQREMYMEITVTELRAVRVASILGEAPLYVRVDAERCENVVHDARQRASQDYDAFILKLYGKIGPHVTATLTGDHVWSYSVLEVTHADGAVSPCAVSRWRTQQITNVSKYGKVFAQWPSREMK